MSAEQTVTIEQWRHMQEHAFMWRTRCQERTEALGRVEARLLALTRAVERVVYQMGPPHSVPRKFSIRLLADALHGAKGPQPFPAVHSASAKP